MFPAKVQFVYDARLALQCKPCSQEMRNVCLLLVVWFASRMLPNGALCVPFLPQTGNERFWHPFARLHNSLESDPEKS